MYASMIWVLWKTAIAIATQFVYQSIQGVLGLAQDPYAGVITTALPPNPKDAIGGWVYVVRDVTTIAANQSVPNIQMGLVSAMTV